MGEILQSLETETTTAPIEIRNEFQEIKVVYLGRRWHSTKAKPQGEVLEAFITLEQYNTFKDRGAETLEQVAAIFGQRKKETYRQPAIVGGVYDMECVVQDFGIIRGRPGTWKFLHRVFDEGQITGWQVMDRAAYFKGEELKALKKVKEEDLLAANMQFLIDAYNKTPAFGKVGFEMAVLRLLRGGAH